MVKKILNFLFATNDDRKVRLLFIMLPKMSAYRRDFDETKCISFFIKVDELLEKYNTILDKFSNSMKKGFYSKPVYNEKYLKTKIKSYELKISISFSGDERLLNAFFYQ